MIFRYLFYSFKITLDFLKLVNALSMKVDVLSKYSDELCSYAISSSILSFLSLIKIIKLYLILIGKY